MIASWRLWPVPSRQAGLMLNMVGVFPMSDGTISKGHDRKLFEERLCSKFGTLSGRHLKLMQPICMDRYGLNQPAFRVLSNLARLAPVSASELGQHTSLEPDKITRATNSLVELGLVSREVDDADRRRLVLRMTARGNQVYSELSEVSVEYEKALLSNLTQEEINILHRAVDILLGAQDSAAAAGTKVAESQAA